MALALKADTLAGGLQECRATHEQTLAPRLADVDRKRAEFDALQATLSERAPIHYCDFVTDGILARAEFEFGAAAAFWLGAKRAKEGFKARMGMTREADDTAVTENILKISALIVLDALLNAGFFLNAHMTSGPLAALLASGLISLVNVGACVAGGYFIGRYIDYGKEASDGR